MKNFVLSEYDNVLRRSGRTSCRLRLCLPVRRTNNCGDKLLSGTVLCPAHSFELGVSDRDPVSSVGFPVAIFEIDLEVVSCKPNPTILVSAIQALPPADIRPNLDARQPRVDGNRIDLPNSLAHVGDCRDLDEPQRLRGVNPCRNQVERVEDVRRLANPNRPTPLNAPDRCMNHVTLFLKFFSRDYLKAISLCYCAAHRVHSQVGMYSASTIISPS